MRRNRCRLWQDNITRFVMTAGGIGILATMLLIFYFLLRESLPVLSPATIEVQESYPYATKSHVQAMKLDRSGQAMFQLDKQGSKLLQTELSNLQQVEIELDIPGEATSFARGTPDQSLYAYGYADGHALLFNLSFSNQFFDGRAFSQGTVEYPFGADPIEVAPNRQPLTELAIVQRDEQMNLFGLTSAGQGWLVVADGEHNNMTEETDWSFQRYPVPVESLTPDQALLSSDMNWLMLLDNSQLSILDLNRPDSIKLHQVAQLDTIDGPVKGIDYLSGGSSILVSHENGKLSQWFFVRNEGSVKLQRIRGFEAGFDLAGVAVEPYRRSFIAYSVSGQLALYHVTSEKALRTIELELDQVTSMAFSDNAAYLAVKTANHLHLLKVDNPHPELNFSSLWQDIWYEHYPEPDQIWQTSAINPEIEPKFSLMPLTVGTLKAAFFTMLFAAPIALGAAVYTAYYMPEPVRRIVKPSIEMMEAMPTVILGFLAGVWLAPFIEQHLLGVFMLFITTPLLMLFTGALSAALTRRADHPFSIRWSWLILIPLLACCYWGVLQLGLFLEDLWFDGDLQFYLYEHYSVDIEQRSALVVGIAMGFAIIPGIFSLAEDAIYGVPQELATGSYALGASRWQTLTRVVLQMASPGIYAALMIGLGRAIGETMILLMVTGNTPLIDWSLFTGMRTVSANIAIEMPETEVGSSHYRVLFLAALVLFLMTFIVNTLAETVRQQMRKRYRGH